MTPLIAILLLVAAATTFGAGWPAQFPGITTPPPVAAESKPASTIDVAAIDRTRILKTADAALTLQPITITKFRSHLSQGGTNDFYSNADYWWPDPTKPDGLPYVNRDGESNPNNFWQHRMAMRDLRDAVAALGRGL